MRYDEAGRAIRFHTMHDNMLRTILSAGALATGGRLQ